MLAVYVCKVDSEPITITDLRFYLKMQVCPFVKEVKKNPFISKQFGETYNWLMDEKETLVTERKENLVEQIFRDYFSNLYLTLQL